MPEEPKASQRLEIAHVLFIDIVGYSRRTVESQTSVIDALNRIVRSVVKVLRIHNDNVIYIPAGVGICIVLLDLGKPHDIQIRLAVESDAAAVADIYRPVVESTAISFETVPPDRNEMARRIADTRGVGRVSGGLML